MVKSSLKSQYTQTGEEESFEEKTESPALKDKNTELG